MFFSGRSYSLWLCTLLTMKSYPALPDSPWLAVVSMVACFKPAEDHTFFFFLPFCGFLYRKTCISAVFRSVSFSLSLLPLAVVCPSSRTACSEKWGKWALRLLTWLPSMRHKVYVPPHTPTYPNTCALFSSYSFLSSSEAFLSTRLLLSVWFGVHLWSEPRWAEPL